MQNNSQFIDRFEQLGLSRTEASVYLALLQTNPATGYKLAKESNMLRPVVYETLTKLVERGGVKIVKSSPEQYSPVPPDTFLALLEKRFTDAKSYLSLELEKVQFEENNQNDDFWNIIGRDTILANIQSMIQSAQHSILFYCNNDLYAIHFKELFTKKIASGIKIIGFSFKDLELPGIDLYSYHIPHDEKIELIPDDRIAIVIDNSQSLLADMDSGKACQSARSALIETVRDFIRMKITLFRLNKVLSPEKLALYLFDEEKILYQKYLQ